MSHATTANGNGTAVLDEVRAALVELLGVKGRENVPHLNTETVDDSEMPLSTGTVSVDKPEPRPPQSVVRVRVDRTKVGGYWEDPAQTFHIIRGLNMQTAKAVAINLNLKEMLKVRVAKWCCVIHFNDNSFGVGKVDAPAEWKPSGPTAWPRDAETTAKAVQTVKHRNRGMANAPVDSIDWWLVAHRLDD